jgi:hypothetical protein
MEPKDDRSKCEYLGNFLFTTFQQRREYAIQQKEKTNIGKNPVNYRDAVQMIRTGECKKWYTYTVE